MTEPTTAPPAPAGATTSRRAFLAGTLAAAGVALLDPGRLAAARSRAAALPAGDLFPLGVASGDPTATSVICWTRLVAPGGDPLPAGDIAVEWAVAADEAFTDVVATGTAPAVGALAHSVHVDVDGLDPDRWYWYRFSVDGRTSPVGRTRTFPGAGAPAERVRFAMATCQNWADGYYTAHAGIAAEDIDLVVFLGDYIYERSADRPPRPLTLPESLDIPTYRARYELYRSDPNLRAAHQHVPWVITLDDHEVANNVLGDLGKDGEAAGDPAAIAAFRQRRADAYQVWYEHLPVRLPAPTGPDYPLYRTVEHSDLLRFYVLDGRQYRSPYPATSSVGGDVPERRAAERTMLGAVQEAWLDERFATTTARWNAVAQQTVMTAMPIPLGATPVFNFDQWDGYVAARERLLRSLVANRVRNPMVLSGDIHLAAAAAVRLDYEDPAAPDIAHEIVTTSISSRFDPELLDLVEAGLAAAPWTRYGNGENRGYALVTVTPEEWRTEFRSVDVSVEQSAVTTDFVDVVADRDPVAPAPDDGAVDDPSPSGAADGPGSGTAPAATPVPGRATFTG